MGRDTVPGFAAAVRRLREAKGWSLEELGAECGTHPQSVAKIEREDRAPSLRLGLALARVLGVTVEEMCANEVPPKKRGRGRPPTALAPLGDSPPIDKIEETTASKKPATRREAKSIRSKSRRNANRRANDA